MVLISPRHVARIVLRAVAAHWNRAPRWPCPTVEEVQQGEQARFMVFYDVLAGQWAWVAWCRDVRQCGHGPTMDACVTVAGVVMKRLQRYAVQ